MTYKEKTRSIVFLNTGCSIASYMTLVVLALFVNSMLSIKETAIIVAIPSLIRVFSGTIVPSISKKISTKTMCLLSIIINIIAYLFVSQANCFIEFIVIAVLNGLAELIYQPTVKCMFAKIAENSEETNYVHKMRYYSICLAGLLGPLIGGVINELFDSKICFYAAAFVEFLMLVVAIKCIPNVSDEDQIKTKYNMDVIRDKVFWGYILSGFLVFFVFSQFETVYSLALKEYFKNTELTYAILLCLNSLFGIVLQSFMIKTNKMISVPKGIYFFEIAFISFALCFWLHLNLIFFAVGVFIYTIGEVTVIPGLDIQIDAHAEDNRKMDYFSIAEARIIGFVLGPIFMGWALDRFNATYVCLLSFMILLIGQFVNGITIMKDSNLLITAGRE